MSKAITIQQKGVAQNITVDKLQVHRAGGTAYWVPEDTVGLSALTATANGEYSAASAGKYGYGYASVSVPGSSVTGTGSDGNQHVITTDGSGAIVDTKVPSEIRIITPPDYVGPYGDGAYISFEGLTVEAFYADGTSAGVIDPQDLSFPVTVARYDPDAPGMSESKESDFDTGIATQPIPCYKSISASATWLHGDDEYTLSIEAFCTTGYIAVAYANDSMRSIILASDTQSEITLHEKATGWTERDTERTYQADTAITINNEPVYAYTITGLLLGPLYSSDTFVSETRNFEYVGGGINFNQLTTEQQQNVLYTMVYGDIVGTSGGVQIPVQYQRPADGLVLAASFGISVVPGPSGGDDT